MRITGRTRKTSSSISNVNPITDMKSRDWTSLTSPGNAVPIVPQRGRSNRRP